MFFMWTNRTELLVDIYNGFSTKPGTLYEPSLAVASLNWHNVINSRFLGDIMARMYIGRWDVDMVQNFGLKWARDSYMHKLETEEISWIKSLWIEGLEMSVFTSTTVTWQLLARTLNRIKRLERGKWVGPGVQGCLPSKYKDKFIGVDKKSLNTVRNKQKRQYRRETLGTMVQYIKALFTTGITRKRVRVEKFQNIWDAFMQIFQNYLPPSKRKVRRQRQMNALSYLKSLGLTRNGKPIKFNQRKSLLELRKLVEKPES
jgi:hypothetical protein